MTVKLSDIKLLCETKNLIVTSGPLLMFVYFVEWDQYFVFSHN